MAGTCTLYAHKNRGPRYAGHKELIAYFECTDGQNLAGAEITNTEVVLITGDLTNANVSAPGGDTRPGELDLSQYENVTLYAYNGGDDEALQLKIYTAPVQTTKANKDAAYAAMTVGLNSAAEAYGWGLEGAAIAVAAVSTVAPQKLSSTGGLIAVTGEVTANHPYGSETIKIWLVGERA